MTSYDSSVSGPVPKSTRPIIALAGEMVVTNEQWAAMQHENPTDAETES